MAKGNISVNTENIFPIIKKWLYSEQDIFVRELVSNAADAITKQKKLAGESDFSIRVSVDKDAKTITFSDNGIGMSAGDVEKYITQVAFSGAEEFLKQYKDENSQIIGHFGLGFYSAFMVAEKVEIKSLAEGQKAVFWSCDGGVEYDIEEGDKTDRGTDIILYINEESKDFLDENKVKSVLLKYCSFIHYPVYFGANSTEAINDTNPLWMRKPSDCKDEEYKEFYRKVFHDFKEPLFYVHLNVDFPFNLKGIFFFPQIDNETQIKEGEVKLYNNQVFVADNVKEVVPEYLLLLKGVIDCPDLPLNVSRSFLQNDGTVKKISDHIVKKVSDKLHSLFKQERENYDKYWNDINLFIKYGCLRDEKFYDRVKDILVFKTSDDNTKTLADFGEGERTIYYTNDVAQNATYVNLYKEQGVEIIVLSNPIDVHFISLLEMKNEGLHFQRIDAELSKDLSETSEEQKEFSEKVIGIFSNVLGENVEIEAQSLKNADIPAVLVTTENSRRMSEMSKNFGGGFDFPEEKKLVLNINNSLIKKLDKLAEDKNLVCNHIYDLAKIAAEPLSGDEMTTFIKRSGEILDKAINL